MIVLDRRAVSVAEHVQRAPGSPHNVAQVAMATVLEQGPHVTRCSQIREFT
ncbi:hypothetical protein [Streptomyces violascens]|uniref:hypothetical protein n=1 Tax=Streptomyces violascens TaxID=67381 RepID=UPI00365AE2A2